MDGKMTRAGLLAIAKPILFNTDMVQAILGGRKTVTRRVIKQAALGMTYENGCPARVPPYQVGDILYVRETWCKLTDWEEQYPDDEEDMKTTYYRADYPDDFAQEAKWRPSIQMPKAAARIFLRVTDVRAERLQDMETPDDINYHREGAIDKHDFIRIWDDTMKPPDLDRYGWYANPWVYVIEFERLGVENI